ncbi:hypothetical protein S40285_01021 [Stachybotrys chlorohalonatus IBT 40285]|uniref:Uncharacterized protein n=1 Tax=Stachybotrys chlorohalonatus (strain IBT 40285) TaxID=1283841 RepID=A0A084QKF5_STAC4|nr:hypothetical protein S40285_01021 [Stachybotrys chlorohalonata IBT 40285]
MATQSSDNVEILVHITAPSRAADDVAYRRLAQAYLAFEPAQTVDMPVDEGPDRSSNAAVTGLVQKSPRSGLPNQDTALAQSPQLSGPDLSFKSVLDNRQSPRIPAQWCAAAQGVEQTQDSCETSQSSWVAPPSQISDSYPMPDSRLLFVSPTRTLQQYLIRTGSTLQSRTASSPKTKPYRGEDASPSRNRTHVPSSVPAPSSDDEHHIRIRSNTKGPRPVIPVTPQLITSTKREIQTKAMEDDNMNDVTHISSSLVSQPSTTSSSCADSEPLPSKRPKVVTQVTSSIALLRSSSDSHHFRARAADVVEQTLEIWSPPPPVGIADIESVSLVSEKLDKLSKDLSSRYRPEAKRDLDPFERGYWRLDCSDWSPETRLGTWIFLTNYLRSGLAGWGVWCRRDQSHNWLRLYCWGHISKHTYLLLYLASGRYLKHTGAEWVDGEGEVVIEVLPLDRQP